MIIRHYNLSKQELMDVYQQYIESIPVLVQVETPTSPLSHSDLDWILKLLKLKGYAEFVSTQLKERCMGRWKT